MTIDYFCKSPKHPLEPGKLDSLPVWLRGSGGDSICASWKGREAPGDYVVEDEGLVAAVNAALVLARPLLVTGEPGTGKTTLADAVAWQLGLHRPLAFNTKSTSVARDLFYTFDAIGRFQAASASRSSSSVSCSDFQANNLHYITFQALGVAILLSTTGHCDLRQHLYHNECMDGLPDPPATPAEEESPPGRSVVLIDEIDKAPRDFPNDLLNEIDRMQFSIPELGNCKVTADVKYRPIIVITSNSEKNLPEPFLRRCCYYHLRFPDEATLARIVRKRACPGASDCGAVPPNPAEATTTPNYAMNAAIPNDLAARAVRVFLEIRNLRLRKPPATSELIDWVRLLVQSGIELSGKLSDIEPVLRGTLASLVKFEDDLEEGTRRLPEVLARLESSPLFAGSGS